MAKIKFETELYTIGDWLILRVPEEASKQLPSRGQVMVEATVNGVALKTPLEPDGNWSHWLKVEKPLQRAIHAGAGDTVQVEMQATKDWPEPQVPADWQRALDAAPKQIQELWKDITPMARWEWIRWIRSTGRQETRDHRVEVGISKMKSGERRPCCWNRNACSEPTVSKSGVLLEPTKVS